jgi:trehalose-6-phosphatase
MIVKAIDRAYRIARERKWDTLYWAIDLHGVCLKSNYVTSQHEFINDDAIAGLQMISSLPESKIILWSAMYNKEQFEVIKLFAEHGITVHDFNKNPEVKSTETGDFSSKWYHNIILDDKAGFDAETDWQEICMYLFEKRTPL